MHWSRVKRFFVGEPLSTHLLSEAKIPKWKALAVLSSDALSSVAYATEEILIPLAAVSVAAMAYSVPIALAIVALMIIVTVSYRETIQRYSNGGGAYVVAKENLGVGSGLVAGASLLIDYVLTVAVSVAAGVSAISSAFPLMHEHRVVIGIFCIVVISILNLRGISESATIFAFPTYLFIFSFVGLLGVGFFRVLSGDIPDHAPMIESEFPSLSIFLILRAFSSGCAALTGIEAISNAVPTFRDPPAKNAKTTMAWMATILCVLFFGITALSHMFHIRPSDNETAVSMLTRGILGTGPLYYVIQSLTALILLLAANTSFSGFPWLAAVLAKDRYLPRQFAALGDRLVFSNSILGLGIASSVLLIIFQAETHSLVPLYSVGVFLGFTLSQAGMVRLHLKQRQPGWKKAITFNALGTLTTFIVMCVVAMSKFSHGAWIVIVLIPVFVWTFTRIHQHYLDVGAELTLIGQCAPGKLTPIRHTVIVPISGIHRGVIPALQYALTIGQDVRACYVEINPETTENLKVEWEKWAHEVPFVVLRSPYRSVIRPVLEYIDNVKATTSVDLVTVVIPEFVVAKWWHSVLHNQTAFLIRAALLFRKGKVVTSVRYHLTST